jgi:hypothetical protein
MLLASQPMAIYLNDHLAGATAGVELARRAAGSNQSSAYGHGLSELAEEIEHDREALADVMRRLGFSRDPVKVAAAWGVEKAGRFKLNGSLFRYSPLSRLEELELLLLGVEGKLALWRSLRRTLAGDDRLRGVDFEDLIRRGQSQRRRLERLRVSAADEALGA